MDQPLQLHLSELAAGGPRSKSSFFSTHKQDELCVQDVGIKEHIGAYLGMSSKQAAGSMNLRVCSPKTTCTATHLGDQFEDFKQRPLDSHSFGTCSLQLDTVTPVMPSPAARL